MGQAIGETADASSRTIRFTVWRTKQILASREDAHTERTLYRLFDKLATGTHATGSATTRRSLHAPLPDEQRATAPVCATADPAPPLSWRIRQLVHPALGSRQPSQAQLLALLPLRPTAVVRQAAPRKPRHRRRPLERALADANALGGTHRPRRRLPRKHRFTSRQGPAHRITQEALKGTQVRTLPKRYNLPCWDVRLALEIPLLTATESGQLGDPITRGLADLIESMISRGLNGRQIWTDLMDHHDYLVTYHSIRHYIRYTRLRTASARLGNPEAQTATPASSP